MMGDITEIIRAAGRGEITYDEANKRLEELNSGLRLNKDANTITKDEIDATVVDDDPTKVTGWGYLNMGVGKPDKVYIENGCFGYDTGFNDKAQAYLEIKDRKYRVMGDHIVAK